MTKQQQLAARIAALDDQIAACVAEPFAVPLGFLVTNRAVLEKRLREVEVAVKARKETTN